MKRLALAVCVAVLSALAISASARADTVTDWNVNAVGALVGTAGQSPTVSTVHLAMVHGAVYDAVNSIDERYEPYLVDVRARDWYSRDAAAATAAYRVLLAIVPAQAATLGAQYESLDGRDPRRAGPGRRRDASARSRRPRCSPRARATAVAALPLPGPRHRLRSVADRPVAAGPARVRQRPGRVGEGRAAVPDRGPAALRHPRPGPAGAAAPTRATSTRSRPIGALNSTTRTAGPDRPGAASGRRARSRSPAPPASSRPSGACATWTPPGMFAMLYMTAADTAIATWTDKARWLFWRPITAIREAAADGNAADRGRHGLAAADQHAAVPGPPVRALLARCRHGAVAGAACSGTACASR